MRIVRTGQDLSGQTIDASLQADGHAQQGLVKGCTLNLATQFVGDCRGTDFLDNDGPADWSQADTYGSYWRGNQNLNGSLWPADIGFLHHEPVGVIIKERANLLSGEAKQIVLTVANFVLGGDYTAASWDTSKLYWWDMATPSERDKLKDAFRSVFEPYPGLAVRFEELVKALVEGTPLFTGASLTTEVIWPDGARVVVDAMNLPVLSDPSRYTMARWIEGQADAQQPGSHYCFAHSVLPPVVQVLPQPDDWLEPSRRWRGY